VLELNHKEFGHGDPLIILHGLFGTLDNWQTIAKKLAENFTVFIVDQRNHGRSPHTEEHGYSCMAEDLHDFMTSKWIYKAHILGHSMGGKTVMRFATEYPDMVDKLIVADIAPKSYPDTHSLIFKALLSIDLTTVETRKEVESMLSQSISSQAVLQFLLKNMTRDKAHKYKWKMNLPVLYKYYTNILKFDLGSEIFDGDTLFIKGGQSDYIQQEDMTEIHKYFPTAKLESIPSAGHWLHAEAPAEFLKIVSHFLEK
jgi:pimeloyl-ACP methyl ester carboxylesterase